MGGAAGEDRAGGQEQIVSPDFILCWILVVGLAVRLIPLFFRAYSQVWSRPTGGEPAEVPSLVWSVLLWLALAATLALAVRSVVRRGSPTPAARAFVVVTVLAVSTAPWTIGNQVMETRPWQLSLPITAAATAVLVSRNWVWCVAALAAIVIPTAIVESGAGWEPSIGVLIGDGLFAVSLFATWYATTRAFWAAHEGLLRARDSATLAFTRAKEAEARTRHAAVWDAFLHDEVISTLALIGAGGDRDEVVEAARTLERRLLSAKQQTSPDVPLAAALLHACMSRYPEAEIHSVIALDACELPPPVINAVADATAEALRNVARHAYAEDVIGPATVDVRHDRDAVRVVISDEGCGFDPAHVGDGSMGILLAIHGRMGAVGGRANIKSSAGGVEGTRVTLVWPAA